ncbi:putative AC transposase, partial [Ananas comosus]
SLVSHAHSKKENLRIPHLQLDYWLVKLRISWVTPSRRLLLVLENSRLVSYEEERSMLDLLTLILERVAPLNGVSTFQYSHERNRRELVLYIVGAEQPYTFAECPYFEHYVKTALNPAYKKTSRNTSRKDSIKAFLEYRQNLISILKNLNSKISLTSDIWTSRNEHSFICVTAHWIDSNWILQKRIIGFQELEFPHTGINIAQAIENVLLIYNISQKIFSISFDNASNNRTAVQILKNNLHPILNSKLFHNKYACHIINLCVHEGLKIISPQIKKLKDCIMFIHSSGPRKQDFKSLCRQMGQKYKKFIFDVQHRWNSTYKMLQYCYEYRNVLTIFYNEKMQHNFMTNEEWDIGQILMNFLQLFYESTKLLSVRKQKQTDFSAPSFNELQFYLQTDFSNLFNEDELDKLDILAWWKTHESTYPVLSAMAHDLLTVQVSTVASESAFSVGGRILDDYRTRLKEDAVEVLVCLKD